MCKLTLIYATFSNTGFPLKTNQSGSSFTYLIYYLQIVIEAIELSHFGFSKPNVKTTHVEYDACGCVGLPTTTITYFLKIFPSICTVALGGKNPSWKIKKKNCSMYSLDTISRQMRSFHSIEHHQKATPFVWLPPNSWRTLCLTEIDRRNTHISTAKIDEAAHKTSGSQKERRKYGPMGYKSFLTQYVAVGHSISWSSFTYFLSL